MSDQPLLVRTPEPANAPLMPIRPLDDPAVLVRSRVPVLMKLTALPTREPEPTIALPHVPIDPATLARVRDGLKALP